MDGIIYGIDVSKDELEFCSVSSDSSGKIKNSLGSIQKFIRRLQTEAVRVVVVEATGGYERLLVAQLWAAEIPVAVVNPRQTWAFGKSLGCEAKTDKIDAKTLALFGARMNPRLTAPLTTELLNLQELQGRRAQLIGMLIAEKNHIKSPLTSSNTKGSIKRIIRHLEREIETLDEAMKIIVMNSPSLKEKIEVIQKIKGAGTGLALQLVANLPELGYLNRRRISALVGVAPFNRDSGSFSGKRHVMGGRREVRSMLYMAAVTAIRCNDKIKSFYIQMVKRGKSKMVALVAAMRKLLLILNAAMREHLMTTKMHGTIMASQISI